MNEKKQKSIKFENWVKENKGYEYYITQFEKIFDSMELFYEKNRAYVYCKKYHIMTLEVNDRSVYLIDFQEEKDIKYNCNVGVQKKLKHEFCEAFNLYETSFKVTQYNFCIVRRYIDKVNKKIEFGFDKYTSLIQMHNMEETKLGFLKIGIHNSFSVAELNNLIGAYNKMYSLVYYLYENGYEELSAEDIDKIENSNSMILESIHIGSEGFFISVLSQVVASGIVALGKMLIVNDMDQYNEKKNELRQEAYNESDEAGRRIDDLIQRWDNLARLRENGRVPQHVIDQRITEIASEIARLQGTVHIDKYV